VVASRTRRDTPAVRTARDTSVLLPGATVGPLWAIWRRLLLALAILLLVVAVVLIDRDGYRDATEQPIGVIDAFYYATVTLSTTGYDDITASDTARLVNVLVVTPARVLFLIILVGTTLEVLTERSREQFRIRRWRSRVNGHVVVCGYGTKGRSAWTRCWTTAPRRTTSSWSSAIPPPSGRRWPGASRSCRGRAAGRRRCGRPGSTGRARSWSPPTDDAAVLTVLTARDLNLRAWIVAAVREAENVSLVRQSGADQVVLSSETAGRLLGLSTSTPQLVNVVEDLLTASEGLALTARPVEPPEVGRAPLDLDQPVVAVVRAGRLHRYDAPEVQRLTEGDTVICVAAVDSAG